MPHNKTLLIKNANIITLNERQASADALFIQNGRIAFIGNAEDAERQAAGLAPIVDAGGATVVPGLIDSHMHLAHTGLAAGSLDLVNATTVEEIVELVRQAAREIPEGEVIFATRMDDNRLKGKRYPTLQELDTAAPRHPVLLRHRTGHSSVINSLALQKAKIPEGTPGIQLDEAGKPNGVLLAQANSAGQVNFKAEIYHSIGNERMLQMAVKEALQAGLTTIHTLEDIPIVQSLVPMLAGLPLRIIIYPQTRSVDEGFSFNLGRFGGCGPSCLDGDIGSQMTAALLEPYASDPSKSGSLYFKDAELKAIVLDAHQRGLQVSMHAVGDRAVAQGLMAVEYAQGKSPRPDARHRIEHWEVHNPELARKAIDLGVWADIQPPFNHFWPHNTGAYAQLLGEERKERVDPIASLIDAGVQVAGGSDSPVTPLNPMLGIHSAVNHSNSSQRITPRQALELFTIQAARIAFEEKDKGTLEIGKLGDISILGANPLSVDPTTIQDIPILYTIVGGEVVYRR
jgi:predicted amidohydrolase YtcJ